MPTVRFCFIAARPRASGAVCGACRNWMTSTTWNTWPTSTHWRWVIDTNCTWTIALPMLLVAHKKDATSSSSVDDPPSYESDSWHVLQTTLKAMSLVHRTWTEPAQRTLRRRIILTCRRSLRSFARSPACGTGVREFAYKIPKSETCTFFHEASVAREHWTTLASVVSRLTTLRFLSLSIESAHLADLSGLDAVLEAVEGLKTLEGLWLHSARDHCPYLPKLCSTISKLPNLRFLSIWNWTCSKRPPASSSSPTALEVVNMPEKNLFELTPPKTLKALQLRDDYLTTPPMFLAWLFQPRGSYSLDTLDLHITFSRPLPPSLLTLPLDSVLPLSNSNSIHTTPSRVDSSHLLAALSQDPSTEPSVVLSLRRAQSYLVLWADGLDIEERTLEESLAKSKRARATTLRLLFSISRTLTDSQ